MTTSVSLFPVTPRKPETSFPPVTASSLHAQALRASDAEVAQMLTKADQLQDATNTVLKTNLAKPGVLEATERFRRELIAWSNLVQSIAERR